MESLISIIIPVYNVAQYLEKCLESVISQTYKNIEVILVDDGSSDESGVICDKYAERDERIKVIHKQNGGVSSARNAALEIVKGDYVCFVDADDYVVAEMVERLVNEIQKGYDIVQCSYVLLYDDRTVHAQISDFSEEEYHEKTQIINAFFTGRIVYSLWNKLFSYKVISGKKFDESIRIAEDKLFVHECLVDAANIKCIPDELYMYVQRLNSATKCTLDEKHFDDVKVLEYFLERYSSEDEIKNSLLINAAKVYLTLLFRIICADYKSDLEVEYRKKVLELRKIIYGSELFNTKEKIIIHILSFAPQIAYKIIRLYLNKY